MSIPATLIASIINGEYDDGLDRIVEAVRSRRQELSRKRSQLNALTIDVGARVRLQGLSPKYLNGLEGTVVQAPQHRATRSKTKTYLFVKHESLDSRLRRYGNPLAVPAGSVEVIK